MPMNIMMVAQPIQSRPWAAFGVAILTTLLEIGFYHLFSSTLQAFPFLLPVTAVTVVAFLCGRWPAILTAFLSDLFVQYYVLPPYDSFWPQWPSGYIGIGFYLSLCAIIIFLMHGMFAALRALQISEASLQGLNDQLEHRVHERTATLVEAQTALRDANQNLEGLVEARVGELRVANDEIQRFAYIVSHDLRAPLVNVLGFTSELDAVRQELRTFMAEVEQKTPELVTVERRLAIDTELPEALGFIRSSTMKMDRLINAILKLSREGRRKLTPQPIDVAALVKAQGDSLSQQLSAKRAELVIEGQLPDIVSDRLAIEQVFGNLIENAVKYLSADRPGHVAVRGRVDGSHLRYEIVDNGRGIAAQDFERIFDLFRRSGEQDTPGEGIGLAYVRNLVRRLGGNVTVQSEYGIGSTFAVVLPLMFGSKQDEHQLEAAI